MNKVARRTIQAIRGFLVVGAAFIMSIPPEYLGMVGCWTADYLRKRKGNHDGVVTCPPGKREPTER